MRAKRQSQPCLLAVCLGAVLVPLEACSDAPSGSTVDAAADAGQVCTPTSCVALGKNCGTVDDGCGKVLDCGTCGANESCGAGGAPNVCGQGTCTPTTCAAKRATCGSMSDGCGATLSCGNCAAPEVCGAGGTTNACGCTPTTCAAQGKNCGTMPDGCGGTLDCGTCPGGQNCGGGGAANVCGSGTCATGTTCAAQRKNCGTISDGCSATLGCGTCTAPQVCGGSGTANVCGCLPTTCGAQGKNCGTISDGCGGTLSCGSCTGSATCGGGGTANVCGGGTDAGTGAPTGLCTVSTSGSYALSPDRGTAWNLAGMLSKGGIPSASWPVCNQTPLAPSGGDDTTAINDAIDKCASGSVVQLGPGTFTMGQGNYVALTKRVVLRGAGAGITILKNPLNLPATQSSQQAADPTPIVIVGPGRWVNPDGDARCSGPTAYQTAYMQTLSADGAKGSTSVTVADGSIFRAGQFVLLDETSNAGWQPDTAGLGTSVWASPDYAVQWMLHEPANGADDPIQTGIVPSAANNWAGSGNGADAACWFSRQDRPQNELKEIASVSGNSVTFTSPLHKNYRVSNHAELTTYTGGNQHVVNAGLEKLSVVGGGDGGVRFQNAAYSWAKNIEVSGWYGEGVSFESSFRVELRDSYIHDAAWAEPGGSGYAISFADGSSELLLENNISIRANKVMVGRSSGSGSVVGYNYMDDGYIATTEGWIEIGLNSSHMVGSHHVLFEGNQSFNMDSDDTHGNSTYHTYFRNYATTYRAKFQSGFTGNTIDDLNQSNDGPKRAAGALSYTYWMSYVGNILGQAGLTTASNGYTDDYYGSQWGDPTIWLLGWNPVSPYTPDPKVKATAVRDGNWDNFLGQQTWLTGTAAPLPNSCYLTSKPGFFGANPWPWVDPTTGAVHTLPAQARYAAGTPNAP